MTITQTMLIFAGIPASVVGVIYALVYAASSRRNIKRYRPGRPMRFTPVWFLANPHPDGAARAAVSRHAALPGAPAGHLVDSLTVTHEVGGASDSW